MEHTSICAHIISVAGPCSTSAFYWKKEMHDPVKSETLLFTVRLCSGAPHTIMNIYKAQEAIHRTEQASLTRVGCKASCISSSLSLTMCIDSICTSATFQSCYSCHVHWFGFSLHKTYSFVIFFFQPLPFTVSPAALKGSSQLNLMGAAISP